MERDGRGGGGGDGGGQIHDRRSRACVRRAATRCAAPFGETRLPGGAACGLQ